MTDRMQKDIDSFLACVEKGDRASAVQMVLDRHAAGMSVRDLVVDLLGPVQEAVGERWKTTDWSVAMEHAATAIVDAALGAISVDRVESPRPLSVVMACPAEEWHSLPRRMAAEVMREAGYDVAFMGASMPPEHLAAYVNDFHVDVVMLGCSMAINLPQVLLAIDQLNAVGVPVMVGGRAFGRDDVRAKAVGAERFVPDVDAMLEALASFDAADHPPALPVSVDPDFWELKARRHEIAARTFELLQQAWDPLNVYDEGRVQRTKEDIDYTLRFLEAAVLTGDVRLWDEYLDWLAEVLTWRGLEEAVVAITVETIEAALDDDLGSAHRILKESRHSA